MRESLKIPNVVGQCKARSFQAFQGLLLQAHPVGAGAGFGRIINPRLLLAGFPGHAILSTWIYWAKRHATDSAMRRQTQVRETHNTSLGLFVRTVTPP